MPADPAPESILSQLLTARQLAAALQMRCSTVEDYARRGLLPSVKLGRHRRFVRTEVEAAIVALASRRQPAAVPARRPRPVASRSSPLSP